MSNMDFANLMQLDTLFETLVAKPDVANAVAAIGSAVLAAAACLISLVSLYVSHRTAKHQETHDRMSVRPLVYIGVGDYENRIYVKIQNNGVGPLILKRITIDGASEPDKPLIHAMPKLPPMAAWTNFVEDISSRSVPPGGEVFLVDLEESSSVSRAYFTLARDSVRVTLGTLTIKVEYTDIYEQHLPVAVRKLSWFHRHSLAA
ncbi:hypothetical protein X551_03927 [Methylibium sp. T29]|nr:hypothetical protein X551_03927 [Methylibium sp. T29]EWS57784.1 hypothetical protein Y694_04271 [Methylibium sp. T29-B]